MITQKQRIQQRVVLDMAYNRYHKRLNSYALFKLNNRQTSQDLVQDTFVKTWGYLVKGGKIEIMKAFLYHILNNLIVDDYRKRKTTSLDTLIEKGFKLANSDFERMPDILDGKEAMLLILRLPEKYQKVMRMRYVQGLTLKEISLITGRSKNAVAVQAHRGLVKLRLLYIPAKPHQM